ncbi:hypothetical protein G6F22_018054 [Rhizopus arrhizus]|nr:hypothetical protein G6F22_018054 [Rhizopus arrhizus]
MTHGGRADGADHDRAVPAGASVVPGGLHVLVQAERQAERGRPARATDAGQLQPRHPGDGAGRILPARRADRPVPHGVGGALPAGPVRRRDRNHPQFRRGHAAQPVPGARGPAAARPRIPDGRGFAHPVPRALS